MKRIYKYKISQDGQGDYVMLPPQSIIRHVGVQGGEVMVWAEVDSEEDPRVRTNLAVVATGEDMPPNCVYIGTVHQPSGNGGEYVWHICLVDC